MSCRKGKGKKASYACKIQYRVYIDSVDTIQYIHTIPHNSMMRFSTMKSPRPSPPSDPGPDTYPPRSPPIYSPSLQRNTTPYYSPHSLMVYPEHQEPLKRSRSRTQNAHTPYLLHTSPTLFLIHPIHACTHTFPPSPPHQNPPFKTQTNHKPSTPRSYSEYQNTAGALRHNPVSRGRNRGSWLRGHPACRRRIWGSRGRWRRR